MKEHDIEIKHLRCPFCLDGTEFLSEVRYQGRLKKFYLTCYCGWNGCYEELISIEEAINIKRTELIDSMLT